MEGLELNRTFTDKDLITIRDLDSEKINLILNTAKTFKKIIERPIKKTPTLRGHLLVNLFYEASTRTRSSFEIAAKYLSADVLNIAISTSSVKKGESIKDTVKTIEAMGATFVVIRHSVAGVPRFISKLCKFSVINAGDGMHEHPTQALLDLFTMREKKGSLNGLRVAIVGDILHSRVAKSNIWALKLMDAHVTLIAPPTLLPSKVEEFEVDVTYSLIDGIKNADIIMLLRMQFERQRDAGLIPSLNEYKKYFSLNQSILKHAKEDVLIMHPGPINRGIEIDSEIADSPRSLINEQVKNSIAVRMAVLYLLNTAQKSGV
jgi:aspartate carbamoyltransferase catalytic subunit